MSVLKACFLFGFFDSILFLLVALRNTVLHFFFQKKLKINVTRATTSCNISVDCFSSWSSLSQSYDQLHKKYNPFKEIIIFKIL